MSIAINNSSNQLSNLFNDKQQAVADLVKFRWPDGAICPYCQRQTRINQLKTRLLWWCGACKKQFSVRTGTIFEGSRLEIAKWIEGIQHVVSQKNQMDAMQLAHGIGISQKTAVLMLGKLQGVIADINQAQSTFEEVLSCATRSRERQSNEGLIQIMNGDCLKKLPILEKESIHLVITDPPYFLDGLDATWKKGKKNSPRGTGTIGGLPVGMKFDPQQGKALQAFIGQVAEQMISVMVPGAFAVVFSQPRLSHRMAIALEDAGFEIRDLYAWHFTKHAQFKAFSMDHFIDRMKLKSREKTALKKQLDGRKTPQLRPQFESMILAQKPRVGTFVKNWVTYRTGLIDAKKTLDGLAPSTVMTVEKPSKISAPNEHLTVKPVRLIEHLIKLFSEPGQVVLDPFLGSGTTALAALRTGRRCIGIEVDATYVELAQKRVKENTQGRN